MAALSNQLLVVTIMAYLVSMLLSAAEYAFGARGPVARAALRPARQRELVGAGGPPVLADAPPSPPLAPVRSPRAALTGRLAVAMFALAALVHLGAVATRGLAADRVPWGNMYEFVLSATFIGAVAWLAVLRRRPDLRHLGLYVGLTLVLLLGIAGLVLYTEVGPLMPALKSAWFIVHIAGAALASGIFLVGFIAAALYLIRDGYQAGKTRFPYSLGHRLPAAATLEPLAFRLHAFAFPIWTFAVAAGAIWAESAWGRYWGWDPKETWAFVSWVVYAGYLHARLTPSVKRRVVGWIAVIGWLTMMMNLFGVNLFISGLHSYAGVG
jgi:cytochrome c-type biogenesis protein CcsB